MFYFILWDGSVAVSPDLDQEASSRHSRQHHTSWIRLRSKWNMCSPNPGYLDGSCNLSPSAYKVLMQTQEGHQLNLMEPYSFLICTVTKIGESIYNRAGKALTLWKPNIGKLSFDACLDCSAVFQQTGSMSFQHSKSFYFFPLKFIILTKIPCAFKKSEKQKSFKFTTSWWKRARTFQTMV